MARPQRKRRRVDPPAWLPGSQTWPRRGFTPGGRVHGYCPTSTPYFAIVGEGPGPDEVIYGYPMIGATGQEVDRHLSRVGLARRDVYVTNATLTAPPDEDTLGEPNRMLEQEITGCMSPVILTLGAAALERFLGPDAELQALHGVPIQWQDRVILPGYHPAAGMHMVELSAHVHHDFDQLALLLGGELAVRPGILHDAYPDPHYAEWTDHDMAPSRIAFSSSYVASDTEGSESRPWGLSWSDLPGTAAVVRAASRQQLIAWRESLIWRAANDPQFVFLLHNSLHDLPILRRLGIDILALEIPFLDTMVLAYQLSIEPQGLKPLGIRHAGMRQDSYQDQVGPYTHARAMAYLCQVAFDPDPPPARAPWVGFEIKHGEQVWSSHKPTRIDKRALKIVKDVESGKVNKDGEEPDPFKRWYQIEPEDRLAAEQKFGVLREATLDDVPDEKAIWYSARDADVTRRIGPVLIARHRQVFGEPHA